MKTRTRLVVGNWKMDPPSVAEAEALARSVAPLADGVVEVGVAPPATALAAVARTLRRSRALVFAQDVHWEERGAFTAQLSAAMIREHAAGAIVGHSEVRRDLGDDDARVALKVARALGVGLRVVLCVGESEAELDRGETHEVVERQVRVALAGLTAPVVIAYEPVWAIGTGRPATAEHASAAAVAIRRALGPRGPGTRLLYGGSVTPGNAGELAAAEGIDGALVGGASLDADKFAAIVRAFR